MFGAKSKKKDDDNSKVMQKSTRGNMDEYQALRTIVAENPGILTRVLEKIRVQRALSGWVAKPKEEGKNDTASGDKSSKGKEKK